MARLGLDDHVRRWVMDWLQDRTFAVKLGDDTGQTRAATRGVPQGSVLGPVLFALVADSLLRQLDTTRAQASMRRRTASLRAVMYADDLTLVASGPCTESCVDCMGYWLRTVKQWSDTEGIPFSSKSERLLCNKGTEALTSSGVISPGFHADGADLLYSASTPLRLLGMVINRSLKPRNHRDSVAEKVPPCITLLEHLSGRIPAGRLREMYCSYGMSRMLYGAMHYDPKRFTLLRYKLVA
jgi:hypothetical protein